jgi:crossover junction endodeoxyribonuclease RusA
MVTLTLPWPPTENTYRRITARRRRAQSYISAKGKQYKRDVYAIVAADRSLRGQFSEDDRLTVTIQCYPPDRRKRDLDNILKALFDAIEEAGVIHDDEQFDEISMFRREKEKGGKVIVAIQKKEV